MMVPGDDRQRAGAFVDDELDVMGQLEVETRLEQDAGLRADVEQLRRLRDAVRGAADYHRAPAELRRRIGVLAGAASPPATPAPWLQRWLAWRPAAMAAMAAGVATLLIVVGPLSFGPGSRDEHLAQEVIASHVRATLGQRLVDVASSDQHTVKPWLSSKLDFSPPVYALQAQGVVFLGGRVDYVDGRPVAALVYKRREHVVDVFIWPTSDSDRPARGMSERGFNVEHGTRGGMAFWLVSDLNREELATLARAFEAPGSGP